MNLGVFRFRRCPTVANFASTSARSRGWRRGTSLFDVNARVGVTGGRLRLMLAPAPSRVRASCSAELHDFREAARLRNIAEACSSSADPGRDNAHLSSTQLHLSSHAAVRTNEGICSNRRLKSIGWIPNGTSETISSWLSRSAAISQ